MLVFRALIRPKSAVLSPWQADILFGHICWVILHQEGESALKDFLSFYNNGSPPLIFSDGFPSGWLPRPLLPASKYSPNESKNQQVTKMIEAKEVKSIRLVRIKDFNALRRGDDVVLTKAPIRESARAVLKNQINRLTGTTTSLENQPGGGNLYSLEEIAILDTSNEKPAVAEISFFVKAENDQWAFRCKNWLSDLAKSGYGAKKSVGYGQFQLVSFDQFKDLDDPVEVANGFISLSNWVPAKNDPTIGYYSTKVKYGKLGENLAASDNPFKFPLIMLLAGSTFYTNTIEKKYYGRLVEGIAPGSPETMHYGYAFSVQAHLAPED